MSLPEIVVDGRGLEPPEPMERVLAALDGLQPGQWVRFLIHRQPYPLYAYHLSVFQLDYRVSLTELDEGRNEYDSAVGDRD
jgi:uncharacterized protein (DUF2249 family)